MSSVEKLKDLNNSLSLRSDRAKEMESALETDRLNNYMKKRSKIPTKMPRIIVNRRQWN